MVPRCNFLQTFSIRLVDYVIEIPSMFLNILPFMSMQPFHLMLRPGTWCLTSKDAPHFSFLVGYPLADPFAKTVPDNVDSLLSYGVEDATICTFDKRGTYLAVGYATGIVVIWDFITRRVACTSESSGGRKGCQLLWTGGLS